MTGPTTSPLQLLQPAPDLSHVQRQGGNLLSQVSGVRLLARDSQVGAPPRRGDDHSFALQLLHRSMRGQLRDLVLNRERPQRWHPAILVEFTLSDTTPEILGYLHGDCGGIGAVDRHALRLATIGPAVGGETR